MNTYKIGVGMTSVNSLVHWGVVTSFMNTLQGGRYPNCTFVPIFKKGIYIDKLRNMIAADFVKSDCDYLWYLDYDNGVNPYTFGHFIEDIEGGADIVSGVYFYREQNYYVAGIKSPFHEDRYSKVSPTHFIGENLVNLTKVSGGGQIGFGCVMITRRVFDKIEFPWFETWWHPKTKEHVTEDTDFCRKAEKAGFDIYLDQRIQSPHMAGETCYPPEWKPY